MTYSSKVCSKCGTDSTKAWVYDGMCQACHDRWKRATGEAGGHRTLKRCGSCGEYVSTMATKCMKCGATGLGLVMNNNNVAGHGGCLTALLPLVILPLIALSVPPILASCASLPFVTSSEPDYYQTVTGSWDFSSSKGSRMTMSVAEVNKELSGTALDPDLGITFTLTGHHGERRVSITLNWPQGYPSVGKPIMLDGHLNPDLKSISGEVLDSSPSVSYTMVKR